MLTGPIPATARAQAGRPERREIGVFEVNEAFAPVPLAWLRETGADQSRLTRSAGPSPSATRWGRRAPA